jgi:metal-responsive CopG/Arc/MetJ family transcriptional regulator
MADNPVLVSVHLPAELVAKLEEMKQYRTEDRDKPLDQLIQDLCRSYVAVREKARRAQEHAAELEQAYRDHPDLWDDAAVWAEAYPPEQDEQP